MDRLRRSMLQLLIGAGSSIALPELSDTWERLAYALHNPYRIDETAMTKMEQLTNLYWELYRGAIAKIDLLSGLQGHLSTVAKLLHVSQPTPLLHRLAKVASNTAQIIGEIYLDTEDTEQAVKYYQFAIEAAKEANNPTLQALALGRKGFVFMHAGLPQQALPLLREAYTQAEGGKATGKSLGWIVMMEAEALSSLRSAETLVAIEKTETVLSQENSGEDTKWTGFNSAALSAYKGACLLRIHQPEQARHLLFRALQDLPPGPTRRESLILADISKSFILQGEIEEACKQATQSLSCAARAKSIRALQEVRAVQKQLAPWKRQPEVKHLTEQLKSVKFA
ncbi:hypothetical protein EPA93_07170 [Ktedonosporobacter rubrisoli]|uniref:MalT-like TPR region domain-containing protein n=1 Tax=Ktedonosporobacter rubrisoli TaxID=2509675 RepID=A0A4P6JKT8_KTERU|nr:hypothetical protein [Ktedonosporobacter rubrisoli]QBD75798.1 hypothetical protein EPA93_07170 [Ktedonosporobacter rubrisoli]